MQFFVSDQGYVLVVPMKSARELPKALRVFSKEVSVPLYLIAEPHPCQKSKEVRRFCHNIGTTFRLLKESTQCANRSELYIGLFKEEIRKNTHESNSPLVFWGYCVQQRSTITNMTVKNIFQLQGQNTHIATFGEQGDI